MAGPRVVTVGHVTHDVYPGGIEAGGCAFYASLTYQALGAEVLLSTAVGEDFQCHQSLPGIQLRAHQEGLTTRFRNIYEPGKPRVQRLDALAAAVPVPIRDLGAAPIDVLHLAPVLQEVDLAAWSQVGPARMRALNIQGWIKKAGPPFPLAHPSLARDCPQSARLVVQTPWMPAPEILNRFDAVCVGAEDLADQGDLLDRLVDSVPIVSCTYGKEGCRIFESGRSVRLGVHPAREVDPTGAGDVFAAAFVFGLASGASAVEAGKLAAASASIVVEDVGPRSLVRLKEEAQIRAAVVPILD